MARRRGPGDAWYPGEALAIYRLKAGLSQSEVASYLGFTAQNLGQLEKHGTRHAQLDADVRHVIDRIVVKRERLVAEGRVREAAWLSSPDADIPPPPRRAPKPVGEPGMCRGRWSVCGGKNPAKSVTWRLCQECTEKRSEKRRAVKA